MQSLADCRHYQHNKFVNRLVSFDVPNHLHLYSKVLSNFIDVHSGLNLSVVSCRRTNVGVRSSLFQSVMVASSMPYIWDSLLNWLQLVHNILLRSINNNNNHTILSWGSIPKPIALSAIFLGVTTIASLTPYTASGEKRFNDHVFVHIFKTSKMFRLLFSQFLLGFLVKPSLTTSKKAIDLFPLKKSSSRFHFFPSGMAL